MNDIEIQDLEVSPTASRRLPSISSPDPVDDDADKLSSPKDGTWPRLASPRRKERDVFKMLKESDPNYTIRRQQMQMNVLLEKNQHVKQVRGCGWESCQAGMWVWLGVMSSRYVGVVGSHVKQVCGCGWESCQAGMWVWLGFMSSRYVGVVGSHVKQVCGCGWESCQAGMWVWLGVMSSRYVGVVGSHVKQVCGCGWDSCQAGTWVWLGVMSSRYVGVVGSHVKQVCGCGWESWVKNMKVQTGREISVNGEGQNGHHITLIYSYHFCLVLIYMPYQIDINSNFTLSLQCNYVYDLNHKFYSSFSSIFFLQVVSYLECFFLL